MRAMKRAVIIALAVLAALAAAPADVVSRVRAWRTEHEKAILHELFGFLSIPNVATDAANIKRNAEALTRMFEKRRFAPDIVPTAARRRSSSPSGGCRTCDERSRSTSTTTASRSTHRNGST